VQWLAHFVLDPEVYITVSFSDLRRDVAQWLARFVRDPVGSVPKVCQLVSR